MLFFDLGEKRFFSGFPLLPNKLVVLFDFFDVISDFNLLVFLKKDVEIKVELFASVQYRRRVQESQLLVEPYQIVDGTGELDHVIHPVALLGPEAGDQPFVGKRPAGKIVVPGMPEVDVVLEEIDMGQNMIKDHHVHPVRIVVVVVGDRRSRIDDRFIRIIGIEFVAALFLENLDVMNPIVVECGDHHLGCQLKQVPVGNDVLQGFFFKPQPGR